ncbi:hypothetical protein CgunFtcFv8_015440 [Champsocephalus gunnari]|uniref:Uncharacterized protein n=1 Tax=Champsocephalus gunnari TaxID=52237 RepID=A0AAN8H131_CHAGU|nr:hypothetical protein CgunFtcFv8_015440 [Champsocephalus gunnari]
MLSAGQYHGALSNKKLELKKTHSGGHNCIHPRYQLSDVMGDPVVITPATETIDLAVVGVAVGKACCCRVDYHCMRPTEESFNEL